MKHRIPKRGTPARVRCSIAVHCAIVALSAGYADGFGAELVVHPDGTGDYPTIQSAVDAAQDGDEVILMDGIFLGAGNRGVEIRGKSIVVRSLSGVPAQCVVDCEWAIYGFEIIFSSAVTLQGLTVTHGTYDLGGAILIVYSSPVAIVNCRLRDNQSEQAAGVFSQSSDITLDTCVIADNRTTLLGGGGVTIGEGSAVIQNCTIANNEVPIGTFGSAIGCAYTTVTVERTIISHNGVAPPVACDAATITLGCSNVFGNVAGDWTGCLIGQEGLRGNMSVDPLFCDPGSGDYTLARSSPCLPPQSGLCGQIGALGEGCLGTAIESESWARMKARYRSGTTQGGTPPQRGVSRTPSRGAPFCAVTRWRNVQP